jgi:peptide/nickel transport system permease protein
MLVYTIRRLGASVLVLIAATFLVFMLVDITGDPLAELLFAVPPVPEETIEARRQALYLDRSTPERYWLWLTGWGATNGDIGLMQGKWGPSTRGFDIGNEIATRFLNTFRLVAVALVLSFLAAIVTGVISAVRQYSKLDHGLTLFAFIGLAMPIFWLAALIKEAGVWANQNVFNATVFYVVGATSPNYDRMNFFEKLADVSGHLVLPTLALVVNGYAVITRFQRASMLEVLNSDYVRLARAKGLRNSVVMRRHALRTALIPVVTLGALTASGLLSGAVVTEIVFRWRGLGTFLVESIGRTDAYAVMAVVLVTGALVIVFNLIADLLYAVLDPRIRL